jgi:hypothetical protein
MKLEVVANTTNATRPTPILFVHGAWLGAWCWENFQHYFAQHGYASYAVSLRGHGASEGRENIRWHSAAYGYVADVSQVADSLDREPIIVGHSMGGYVAQKYLERHSAEACVLLATCPVSGTGGFAARFAMRHPWAFIKSQALLSLKHATGTPELVQDTFFSPQVPAEEIAQHFASMQQESFRMELETLFLNLPQPENVMTPMLVLGAENDRVFSVAEQQATARAYGTEAEIFPAMAHVMMLEPGWKLVADRIISWAAGRGL